MRRSVADLIVIADDLSGAAESATALTRLAGGRGVPVHLLGDDAAPEPGDGSPIVIDTDTRATPPAQVALQLEPVTALLTGYDIVVKKVDSLLRGPYAAELEWLRGLGRSVVLAPALPASDRIVRDGRVFVQDVPLAETPAWAIEPVVPPPTIQKSFSSTAHAPLSLVRATPEELTRAIASSPGVLVCDAETADDLRRIARAALAGRGTTPILAGSSAMVRAVADELAEPAARPASQPGTPPDRGESDATTTAGHVGTAAAAPSARRADGAVDAVTFVVGTAEPSAQRQLDRLESTGAHVARLDPLRMLADPPAAAADVAAALDHRVAALAFDPGPGFDHGMSARLAAALADTLAAAPTSTASVRAFVLTGGQTARAILDRWHVRTLTVVDEIDTGAALARTDAGATVVTRPGSFGDDESFVRMARALTARPLQEGRLP